MELPASYFGKASDMGLRVAALYDVHGNLPALDAVLTALADMAVAVVVFGGDVVWGPWPAETLARAQSLGERARFLRGNCESSSSTGSRHPTAGRATGSARSSARLLPPGRGR